MPDFAAIRQFIDSHPSFLLVCHRKPDGDALGATLGLGWGLRALGKEVRFACYDPVPHHYRFLAGTAEFRQDPDQPAAAVIMLDCGADHLVGWPLAALGARPLADIDHHPKPGPPTTPRVTVYDDTASSTAEIIAALLPELGVMLDRRIATALLTGIVFDTAAFQNANTTAHTLRASAVLLRRGAKLKDIIRHSFYSSSVPKLKLWGTAMSRIEQNAGMAGIVSTVLTDEDLRECGAHPDDIEGLVNFLNAIPGVPALMLLTSLGDGEIKGSLRTRQDDIDVSSLAGLLGGGGHRQAAGFAVKGQLVRAHDDSWQVVPADA